MFYILTCNGYVSEDCTDDLERAVELCAHREQLSGDGYARVVVDGSNGRHVADSLGIYSDSSASAYERQEGSFGESP
jgi:hypothetical protein